MLWIDSIDVLNMLWKTSLFHFDCFNEFKQSITTVLLSVWNSLPFNQFVGSVPRSIQYITRWYSLFSVFLLIFYSYVLKVYVCFGRYSSILWELAAFLYQFNPRIICGFEICSSFHGPACEWYAILQPAADCSYSQCACSPKELRTGLLSEWLDSLLFFVFMIWKLIPYGFVVFDQ